MNQREFSYAGERAVIRAAKIFDAGLRQITRDNQQIILQDIVPANPAGNLTFISGTGCNAMATDVTIERVNESNKTSRVRSNIHIPLSVVFLDQNGTEHRAASDIMHPVDVLLNIPDQSIVPFRIEPFVSAVLFEGRLSRQSEFYVKVCITLILKVIVDVDLIVPTFGYYKVPPLLDFSNDACSSFFELPLFPQN